MPDLSENGSPLSRAVRRLRPYRIWIQTGFLALWLAPLKFFSACGPVFHCDGCPLAAFACPIGTLARAGAAHVVPFGALAVLIVVGATLGTMICGWACPFGWLQDLAAKVPTPKFSLPKWTGNVRYAVLAVPVLAIPIIFGDHPLFVCRLCPAAGLEVSVPRLIGRVAAGQPAVWPDEPKFIILVAFLIAIFFFRRPFCRVLCPLGAIYSLFNRFSLVKMRVKREACTDCGRCYTLCASDIEPEKKPNDLACNRCFECLACPRKALDAGTSFDRPESRPSST